MSSDFNIDTKEDRLNDTEPIYVFPKLKEKLSLMGVNIGIAGAWRSVGTVDVLFFSQSLKINGISRSVNIRT